MHIGSMRKYGDSQIHNGHKFRNTIRYDVLIDLNEPSVQMTIPKFRSIILFFNKIIKMINYILNLIILNKKFF